MTDSQPDLDRADERLLRMHNAIRAMKDLGLASQPGDTVSGETLLHFADTLDALHSDVKRALDPAADNKTTGGNDDA